MDEEPHDKRMHEVYLPFTEEELRTHFVPISGGQVDPERPLNHCRRSLERLHAYAGPGGIPKAERRESLRATLQIEKDEHFWVIAALLGAFRDEDRRVEQLSQLLTLALGESPPIPEYSQWQGCLKGALHRNFEVSLPSHPAYRAWLAKHLDERTLMPHLREAAATSRWAGVASVAPRILAATASPRCERRSTSTTTDASTTNSFALTRRRCPAGHPRPR